MEEHTVASKRILTYLIYSISALHLVLFAVDRLPLALSALSIASHAVYYQNLRRFPVVKLTDPIFLVSCVLVLGNHWFWFRHFSLPANHGRTGGGRYAWESRDDVPTFTEIASFFGLGVWLVPFALFVSLSAGENILPSMGSEYATGAGSSFVSPGQEPSSIASGGYAMPSVGGVSTRTRHRRSNTQTGMAKAAVNGVREWVGEAGELMGFWRGERTRPL